MGARPIPSRITGAGRKPGSVCNCAADCAVPFSVKLTVCPAKGPLGVLSVAESVVLSRAVPATPEGATGVTGCATVTVAREIAAGVALIAWLMTRVRASAIDKLVNN